MPPKKEMSLEQFHSSLGQMFAPHPLFEHAAKGSDDDLAAIKQMVEAGTPVNSQNGCQKGPLFAAAASKSVAAAQLLLSLGANVNARGISNDVPLHVAAGRGCTDIVRLLIDHGADIHARDDDGATPLHMAVDSRTLVPSPCRANVVELLLNSGANATAVTKSGTSSLGFAARNGNVDACRLLLQAGAPLDESHEENKHNAVMSALCAERSEVVRFLLKVGASVNKRINHGITLLHMAVLQDARTGAQSPDAVVPMLLDAGAKMDVLDDDDNVPLCCCEGADHGATPCELMLAKGTQLALGALQV